MSAEAVAALTQAGFTNPPGRAVQAVASIAEATASKFGTSTEAAAHAAAQAWAVSVGLAAAPGSPSAVSTPSAATSEESIAREMLASVGIK